MLGVVLLVLVVRFIAAYLADRSLTNKATYVGAIIGAVSLLVVLVQFVRWLRRREHPLALTERLRAEIRGDLGRRLDHMRRTSENISLTYRPAERRPDVPLEELARALAHEHARVVIVGDPGHGKSYSALEIALNLIRHSPILIPLVVPLSRWTEDQDIASWLSDFITTEFKVSRRSAHELIESGSVIALFDGLDELCGDTVTEPTERFLERLIEWRLQGDWASFLLTCRYNTWNGIGAALREHHTLDSYAVLPVRHAEAAKYLSRSLGGTDTFEAAFELARLLRATSRESLLTSPWRLSLVAELARSRLNAGAVPAGEELVTAVDSADAASLVTRYVESVGVFGASALTRWRNVLDLWWLSKYAKYLERNRSEQATVAGRPLPTRDIMLHRLWPAAGRRSPLIVDFLICVLLSMPGFVWASRFLWDRGVIARISLLLGAAIWTAMLTRTSTKPWVRAATPDWSRLANPRFFLRQVGAALVIGIVAGAILGPWAAVISFVTAWLAIGLTVGFGQTLATDTRPEVVGPLGVLRRERQVSRLSAAVAFPALAWGFSLTWGPRLGIGLALMYCLVVGETVACALWRRYLAMIVVSIFRLPPAPARFMQRMCSLGLLRVAGISYQFRHDDILHHFAHRHDLRDHFTRSMHRAAYADQSGGSRRPIE